MCRMRWRGLRGESGGVLMLASGRWCAPGLAYRCLRDDARFQSMDFLTSSMLAHARISVSSENGHIGT